MPEFAEEVAEVRTTKFTTPAAPISPARANMPTNGDSSALYVVQGRTAMRTISDPT